MGCSVDDVAHVHDVIDGAAAEPRLDHEDPPVLHAYADAELGDSCLLVVVVEEVQESIGLRCGSEHIVDVVDLRRLVGGPYAVPDDIHLAHIVVGI